MLLFGSANTTAGSTFGQGVYVSTNGGLNWYGTDLMPNEPAATSDPAPAIDKNGVFIFTSLNIVSTVFMYGQYSTNYGVNWSTPYTIYGSSSDKNLSCSDDVPSSPYYGRSYTVWTIWSGSYPIGISYTTNSGVSWSTAVPINSPSTMSQGADVVVGPAGVVYATWSRQSGVSLGCGFAKSTNGGVNWIVNEAAFSSGGMRSSSFNGWGVRVNDFPRIAVDKTGGPRNGWIYIVDCEKNLAPAGSDEDILLHRSTDGGTTWSSGIRVNQDALNNGKVQFFPCVVVDPTGGVNVLYYDNRNYPSVGDSCETYLSRSLDGGTTWTDTKVSDHRWKPAIEPGTSGGYMGDYIGMAAANGKLWPFWFDNKSGSFQAWTCSIDFGPAIAHTPLGNSEQTTGTRQVNCTITPAGSGINPSKTKLFYGKGAIYTDSLIMTNTSGTNWSSTITLSGPGTYKYYITTTDSLSRTATAPAGAPGTFYSFIASTDTVHPVITHTQFGPTPKSYWPVTVTANVTDNIGVDSVWVLWYKNTPTTIKEFKLLPAGSDNYSAAFNSINSDVNIGDVIYYKIMADDISSNHNVTTLPTSGYFSFGIVNLRLCEGFSNTTFPPANWTVVGAGATYWSYNAVSSYGIGTGSARFNFYNASSGTVASLVSLQFDPSVQGDSLRIDLAHAFYNASSIDTLAIETSTNGGTTFTPLWTLWSNTNFTDPHSLSTISQLSIFTPTPSQWKTVKYGLPTGTNMVRFRASSGYGNDMFMDSICQVSGPVGIGNNTTIPLVYSLSQNYPNPFNPVTQIKYGIPKQGLVTMKIYDVLGREVTKLVNEVKTPGNYIVEFDGSKLASGVYFYRLESNEFVDVKKMMLIK
jgi:hypothetical protein